MSFHGDDDKSNVGEAADNFKQYLQKESLVRETLNNFYWRTHFFEKYPKIKFQSFDHTNSL